MLTRDAALALADAWSGAWNAHDDERGKIARVVAHYDAAP
jgi:hypothetical protein